ncbi:MAG: hypothetical protein ABW199_04825 [Caulobacterales bacterium]
MQKKHLALLITATAALAACSHGGSRHYSGGGTGTTDPVDPSPSTTSTGTLERTTDTTTTAVGEVLHVAGNVVLGVSEQTNLPLDGVGHAVNDLGDKLETDGVDAVPLVGDKLDYTIRSADNNLNGVARVEVAGIPVAGSNAQPSSNQLIGVSAGSENPPSGTLATVGVLSKNGDGPVTLALGETQILGAGGTTGGASGSLGGVTGVVGSVTGALTTPLGGAAGGAGAGSAGGGTGGGLGGMLGSLFGGQ